MSQFTDYGENKIIDWLLRAQSISLPTNWYIAAGSAGSDSGITEITGIGLARAAVLRALASFAGTQAPGSTSASSGTSHATSNNADINLGAPTGTATMTHIGVFDASSSGNCWIWVPLPAPVSISSGVPAAVKVLAGALQLTLGLLGGCSDYLANKLIDLIFRGQAFTPPTPIYEAMYTVAPTSAGGGTEASGGSYARSAMTPSLANFSGTQAPGSTAASSGTSGRSSNNNAIAAPAPTSDFDVVALGTLDAATSGNLLFSKVVPTFSVRNGGPAPTHAPNALGFTLA